MVTDGHIYEWKNRRSNPLIVIEIARTHEKPRLPGKLTLVIVECAYGDTRFSIINQNPVVPGDVPFVFFVVIEWIRASAPCIDKEGTRAKTSYYNDLPASREEEKRIKGTGTVNARK